MVASRLITWSRDLRLGVNFCADASGGSVPQILERGSCHDSSVNVTIKIPALGKNLISIMMLLSPGRRDARSQLTLSDQLITANRL